MIYSFDIKCLPEIEQIYTVFRRTVWEIADSRNILLIVLEGKCYVEIEKEVYTLKAGDVIFIPENQIYKRTPAEEEGCKMLYIHFKVNGEIIEMTEKEAAAEIYDVYSMVEKQLLNDAKQRTPYISRIYLNGYLQPLNIKKSDVVERVLKLIGRYNVENSLMTTLCMCELLSEISRKNIKNIRKSVSDEGEKFDAILRVPHKLKKAVHYIRQNYKSVITLDDLCDYCSVSKSQLTRYFKEVFGKTPIQYIIELKLNSAKELFLNSPQRSIKNVSSELGFEDQHYFSRVFTKYMGETPSEYKYRVNHYMDDDTDTN